MCISSYFSLHSLSIALQQRNAVSFLNTMNTEWYGIVEFNVLLDTVQVISETGDLEQ